MDAGLNYRGVSAMIMSDLFSRSTLPDVVVHTGNSNTWEAEEGGAPVGEQLVYIMTSYLKNTRTKEKSLTDSPHIQNKNLKA